MRILIAFLLVTFRSSPAQELGLSVAQLWTNNSELLEPTGIGVYVSKSLSKSVVVRLSYEGFKTLRTFEGVTGNAFLGESSVQEQIRSESRAQIFRLGLSYFPLHFDWVYLGFGISVSENALSLRQTGTQTSRLVINEDVQKLGLGYSLNALFIPSQSIPMRINISVTNDFLERSRSEPVVVQPYTNPIITVSLQLAAGFSF
ncbi:MAG: hypothetical protein HY562_03825 [Ignavibacteriales bacterium]|nr:hypothetical protein [Ignavibacteriales bacterium]